MEIKKIHDIVSNYYNIDYDHKKHDHRRNRELIVIREFVYYFARKYTKLSYFEIGKFYNKDHSSAILGRQRMNGLIEFDKIYSKDCNNLDILITNSLHPENIYANFTKLNKIMRLINKIDLLLLDYVNTSYFVILENRKNRLINLYIKSQL